MSLHGIKSSSLIKNAYDPYFDKVALLVQMDGNDNGTVFIDKSSSNHIITPNGSAITSSLQSKFGATSLKTTNGGYGVNNNLTLPTNSSLFLNTNDFTIEGWFYFNSNNIGYQGLASCYLSSDYSGWVCVLETNNCLCFYGSSSGSWNTVMTTSTIPSINQWHHIAICRSGSSIVMYLNGVSIGSITSSNSIQQGSFVSIGGYKYFPSGQLSFNGYIDSLRITNGIARYVSNFTVPKGKFQSNIIGSDRYFNKTSLLLKADGENGSTSFQDLSPNKLTLTPSGNAQISTVQSKFGSSSMYFDGSGGYITAASNSVFNFGSGDFTYEWWFKSSATNAYSAMVTRPYTSTGGILISLNGSSGDGRPEIYWREYVNDLFFKSSLSAKNDNQWHHFAFVRSGTNCYMFLDGVVAATKTSVSTSVGQSELIIGTDTVYGGRSFLGYIDDVRITKGMARYTSNFAPPVRSLLDIAPGADRYFNKVSLLAKMNGGDDGSAFIDESSNKVPLEASGNVITKIDNKKFGISSAYFDGTNDLISTPSALSIFDMGTGDFTVECWFYTTSIERYMYICGPLSGNGYAQLGIYVPTSGTQRVAMGTSYVSWPLLFSGSGSSVQSGVWTHLAVCRASGQNHCFLNGVRCGSIISDSTAMNFSRLTIGKSYDGPSWLGYIDEFRLTKGVARYTSDFTPPEKSFQNY